jgi:hypothetical protein
MDFRSCIGIQESPKHTARPPKKLFYSFLHPPNIKFYSEVTCHKYMRRDPGDTNTL